MIEAYWEHRQPRGGRPVFEECAARGASEFVRSPAPDVLVVATAQPFGGVRLWALCPRCRKRRAWLLETTKGSFVCRVCARVPYLSQRLSPLTRQHFKAHKRLTALGGVDSKRVCRKPPWMRWSTYAKRIEQLHELDTQAGLPDDRRAKPDPRLARRTRAS